MPVGYNFCIRYKRIQSLDVFVDVSIHTFLVHEYTQRNQVIQYSHYSYSVIFDIR